MEKEQKKLLLVAVSVGVFLLVTITVAVVLLTPKNLVQEPANYASSPYQAGLSQPVEIPQILPEERVIEPVNQGTNANNDIVNIIPPASGDSSDGENLTIQIPKPTTAAVPDTPEIITIAPVRVTPAAASTTVVSAARPSAPTQQTRTAAAASGTAVPAASRTINDYWIQTGAFTAMVRAEDAKELLAEKGLVSIIENREINGQVWYRVRLGPYTSEREADYWLALVKSIDGFEQSQIRQTTRTQ